MRISISAQSAASTPPAPERILITASRGSYSPESMVVTSRDSMADSRESSSSSAREESPSSSASSYMTGMSSRRPRSASSLRTFACAAESSEVTFWACSGSSHRDGSPAWASSSRMRAAKASGSMTFSMVVRVDSSCLSRAVTSGRIGPNPTHRAITISHRPRLG